MYIWSRDRPTTAIVMFVFLLYVCINSEGVSTKTTCICVLYVWWRDPMPMTTIFIHVFYACIYCLRKNLSFQPYLHVFMYVYMIKGPYANNDYIYVCAVCMYIR